VTKQIFHRIRNFNEEGNYWNATGNVAVKRIRDITMGYDSTSADKKSSLPVTPDSEMLMLEFENNCSLIVRTSGTEPKIKLYSEMVGQGDEMEEDIKERLKAFIELCIEEMIQPNLHGLTRP
jgi:phosphoglucomutase